MIKRGFLRPRGFRAKPRHALKRTRRRFKACKPLKVGQRKVWPLKRADNVFSLEIRARDGKCLHPRCICGSQMLQCSHYFGRAIKSTRYDPDNCITLGWLCHYKNKRIGFEYQKQTVEEDGFDGQYTIFMRNHLGEERFNALCARAKISIKQTQAILAYQQVALAKEVND